MIGTCCILGRAPRTKETLLDFHEWCRVTRHPRIFRGLTGCQRTPRFWGVTKTREKDEPFSSLLFLSLFSLFILPSFSLSLPIWSNLLKWDALSCHMSPSYWLSWISPYPLIHNFGFPFSYVVTQGHPLDFLTFPLHLTHGLMWVIQTSAKCHSLPLVP